MCHSKSDKSDTDNYSNVNNRLATFNSQIQNNILPADSRSSLSSPVYLNSTSPADSGRYSAESSVLKEQDAFTKSNENFSLRNVVFPEEATKKPKDSVTSSALAAEVTTSIANISPADKVLDEDGTSAVEDRVREALRNPEISRYIVDRIKEFLKRRKAYSCDV